MAINEQKLAFGANGQIQYAFDRQLVSDVNLFWDSSLLRLGLGTNTPAYMLDVSGDVNSSTKYRIGTQAVVSSGGGKFKIGDVDNVGGIGLDFYANGGVAAKIDGSTGFFGVGVNPGYPIDTITRINITIGADATQGYLLNGNPVVSLVTSFAIYGDVANTSAIGTKIRGGGFDALTIDAVTGLVSTENSYVNNTLNVQSFLYIQNPSPSGTGSVHLEIGSGLGMNIQGDGFYALGGHTIFTSNASRFFFGDVNLETNFPVIFNCGSSNRLYMANGGGMAVDGVPSGTYNLEVFGSFRADNYYGGAGTIGVTGTFANPTSITVENGIVTAVS